MHPLLRFFFLLLLLISEMLPCKAFVEKVFEQESEYHADGSGRTVDTLKAIQSRLLPPIRVALLFCREKLQ